jgi:hypothetical protein
LYGFQSKTCRTCLNSWYVNFSKPPGGVKLEILEPHHSKHKNICRFSKPDQEECDNCLNDVPDPGMPKMFTLENNLHFGSTYPEITALSTYEEMLISKVTIFVSVFTLTSTGFLSYQGHSCSFYQDNVTWFNTLPINPADCPIILITRKGVSSSNKQKAFAVDYDRLVTGFKK